MYGYSITINGIVPAKAEDICYKNIVCSNHMIKKFENDKVFTETEDFIILLDGIVLNRLSLMENNRRDNKDSSWADVLLNIYKEKGEIFFSVLRGSFSGALYDKQAEKWIIFGDQIGSKFTYYTQVGDFFCCTQMMGNMYEMIRKNNVNYHLDELGVWMLLTYGYMLDNYTLCKEVRKINPGCYIVFQKGKVEEHRFYLLDNTPDNKINEQDAIEIVDKYFRQAIIRQFEKDREYGYKHLVALSGGLDCRMTTFVAHDCGYTKQLNMTFSQTDYWDQTLPMRMARDLYHEWIFKALDNGMWLYDVDDVTKTTGGNVLYYGTAHGNSLLRYINFEQLGLIHSGQIGDVVIGSFIRANEKNKPYVLGSKAYSSKYLKYLNDYKLQLELDMELGKFYYRAFHGTNNGLQNCYNYTETLSPFLDLDMLEKSLTIPVYLRQDHRLYKKWILAKYPDAAKYEWETTGHKITAPTIQVRDRDLLWAEIPHVIITHVNKALRVNKKDKNVKGMNPIAYYLAHNKELTKFLDTYFSFVDNLENVEIRGAIKDILTTGTAMEKIQAVSLLAAVKMFYC